MCRDSQCAKYNFYSQKQVNQALAHLTIHKLVGLVQTIKFRVALEYSTADAFARFPLQMHQICDSISKALIQLFDTDSEFF